MSDEDYASEKLKFVSDLNGTSLNEVVQLLTAFPLINLFSILVKIVFLVGLHQKLKPNDAGHYWKSFLIDYLFCIVPLICVCTILSEWIWLTQFILMSSILILYRRAKNTSRISLKSLNSNSSEIKDDSFKNDSYSFGLIEEKIIRLSISTTRLWLYLLTCVSILAVDFKIFPRSNAKTENYGVSLMDLGVGFYIVGHSMKIIRNSNNLIDEKQTSFADDLSKLPSKLFYQLKSSSILILFGILRLISVKSTGYVEHVSEYGVHWNFMFTIVLVKLLVCPFQVFIQKSSLRSLLCATIISFYYQYILKTKNYTSYLLNDNNRSNFLDANKEGIFSCVGYLAIYLTSQSILYRLSNILSNQVKKSKIDFTTVIKCILNLLLFIIFFLIALLWTSENFQNVSRRLCNMSFVLYIMFSSTLLLMLFMIGILMVSKLHFSSESNQNDLKQVQIKNFLLQIEQSISFAFITDSKFVGLIIFLSSNILTGIVNLTINTLKTPNLISFIILCVYSFVSFGLGFLFYFYWNSNSKKTDSKKSS